MPILRAAITPLNQLVGVIAYCKSGRTIDSGRLCSTSIAMCQIRVAVEERLESACVQVSRTPGTTQEVGHGVAGVREAPRHEIAGSFQVYGDLTGAKQRLCGAEPGGPKARERLANED